MLNRVLSLRSNFAELGRIGDVQRADLIRLRFRGMFVARNWISVPDFLTSCGRQNRQGRRLESLTRGKKNVNGLLARDVRLAVFSIDGKFSVKCYALKNQFTIF